MRQNKIRLNGHRNQTMSHLNKTEDLFQHSISNPLNLLSSLTEDRFFRTFQDNSYRQLVLLSGRLINSSNSLGETTRALPVSVTATEAEGRAYLQRLR